MTTEDLDAQMAQARAILSRHWEQCLKFELEGHSKFAHDSVDRCLDQYFSGLKALPEPDSAAAILDVMKRLFLDLGRLNAETDGALLETDEREVLVPIVITAAAARGLRVEEFEDGDPTFEFRNF